MHMIEVDQLKKQFVSKKGPPWRRKKSTFTAVDGVSFAIPAGSIFSLLGPNGAGKTTTIKMLATLLVPTAGRATVAGYDVVKDEAQVRRELTAVLPGERTLYWKLTARENLRYFGTLYGLPRGRINDRIIELARFFELDEKLDALVEKLSTGQRQKVVLCRALLPSPRVILLDEPTLGLDPVAARGLRQMIRSIKAQGTTVLLTTHYMFEADELSDTVAIINDGRIAAMDTPRALKQQLGARRIVRATIRDWSESCSADVRRAFPGDEIEIAQAEGVVHLTIKEQESEVTVAALGQAIATCGATISSLSAEEPTLEDVFVTMTGNRINPASEESHEPAPIGA